jgi:threonine/homoserine/homoserine lactone efflux protein
VSGNWVTALANLIPLALVVALSPFSILPAVLLVVHSARPRATGLAFLVGWLLGLGAMTVLFVEVPRFFGDFNQTPRWSHWARIIIGALLIAAAVWRWVTRRKVTGSPSWLNRLHDLRPGNAAVIGFVLTLINVKFIVVCAAAGLAISAAQLGTLGTWLAVALYTLLAGSTAAIPVLAHAVAAKRLDTQLDRLKEWMERQQAALTAVILAAIGVVLLFTGVREL